MLFSTFKADAKLWESLSRWISPLLSPFPCYPSSTTARRTWLCLSVLQMKKWRHSLHISCWFKPWRGKGRSVKFQNPTLPAVFSIMHLRFFFLCQLFSLWFMVSPFSRSTKSHSRAFGSPPSVHSTRHPQLPLQESDRQCGEWLCELCPRFSLTH